MSEDLIIKHCSPTLAGLKTGNLFSCSYYSKEQVIKEIAKINQIFVPKGVRVIPLKFSANRALIYVFRPSKLAGDLSDDYSCYLLKNQGYSSTDVSGCVRQLIRRMSTSDEFPHEIGLFLGYPPEDVNGFILHKGNCCKCSGCWKVYGNEEKALKQFAKFKKCSDIYYSKWLHGTSIQKLTVAV